MAEELRVPYQAELVYVYNAPAGIAADSVGNSLPAEFENGNDEPDEVIKNRVM